MLYSFILIPPVKAIINIYIKNNQNIQVRLTLKILMRDLRFWLWISWESWLLDLERIWLRAALRTFS